MSMRYLNHFFVLIALLATLFLTGLFVLVAYSQYLHPQQYPLLACAGLTFPLFLSLNLVALVCWLLIGKWKYALIPLAGFLLCFQAVRTYFPINLLREDAPEGSLKILSYNTQSFHAGEKTDGRNAVLDYLKDSGADLICLQEYVLGKRKKFLTEADVIEGLKDYPYHRVVKTSNMRYANQVALFSKYPIVRAEPIRYPSENNGSALYAVKIGSDTLYLINNHLESNKLTIEEKALYEDMIVQPKSQKVKENFAQLIRKLSKATVIRSVQADSLSIHINRLKGKKLVVCGDFNDSPISYTHSVIGRNLTDAFVQSGNGLGISYNRNKFYFKIDHILISKQLESYQCTVDKSIRASDHYPIWCYISMKR